MGLSRALHNTGLYGRETRKKPFHDKVSMIKTQLRFYGQSRTSWPDLSKTFTARNDIWRWPHDALGMLLRVMLFRDGESCQGKWMDINSTKYCNRTCSSLLKTYSLRADQSFNMTLTPNIRPKPHTNETERSMFRNGQVKALSLTLRRICGTNWKLLSRGNVLPKLLKRITVVISGKALSTN